MSDWPIAAKNLLEEKTCNNCRFLLGIDKCVKMPIPRPEPNVKWEGKHFHCPEIGTCPLWEKK